MTTSMFDVYKKYILFEELCMFKISLYFIFNEENYFKTTNGEIQFVLTYEKFKIYLLKLRQYAKNSCGIVCQSNESCFGHKALELMQQYEDFMFDSVERCKLFYKQMKFIKRKNDDKPMLGFIIEPFDEVDLGWHSWSQRMRYLLI